MYKLCTLKSIVPGSVMELPQGYQYKDDKTAIVCGLEYASDKSSVRVEYLRQNGPDFIKAALPSAPDTSELAIVDDKQLEAASVNAFVTNRIKLPALGMSVGCDPEIFVVHEDDSIFPAWNFLPTEAVAASNAKQWLTQQWKYRDDDLTEFDLVTPNAVRWDNPESVICPQAVPAYWDGAQAEFAPWGKICLETLHYGIRVGLKTVLTMARRYDKKAKLTLRNVIELPQAILKNTDNEFIQFRCSTSYNIYEDMGEGVQDARAYAPRCAGGHIHIGYNRKFTAPAIEQIVRGLDGVLGVAGVSLAAGIDNPERRRMYGRAGEFRMPAHGMEYRVLSNWWLSHPATAMLVFELARSVVRFAESGLFNLCWKATEEETRRVINECDIDGAREILSRNIAVLNGLLSGIWTPTNRRSDMAISKMKALAFKAIMEGIGAVIPNPFDIEKNWKLDTPDSWRSYCAPIGDNWQALAERA